MKVESLNLANFRAFEQIEISFEEDLTVLAGVNGVGKTAILDAIRVILSRAMPECTEARPQTALSFADYDVAVGSPSLEVSAVLSVADQRCHGVVQRVAGSEDAERRYLLLERLRSTADEGNLDSASQETRSVLRALRAEPNQPVAMIFTPGRLLSGRPQRLHTVNLEDKTRAYTGALEDRPVELREFMEWFNAQQQLEAQREAEDEESSQEQILEALQEVVSGFVPEFRNLRIEREPKLRFLVDKSDIPLELSQLSDGERGLLAIMFDITRRLTIANPGLEHPISDGKGVVLIDEVELHLHPRWQREAVRRLKSTFSGCQFIVTTHSPQVLGEVDARCVRYLYREPNGRVAHRIPEQARGLDSAELLEELMDADRRTKPVNDSLREIFALIDEEQFSTARERIAALREELHGSIPELVRANSLITMLSPQDGGQE